MARTVLLTLPWAILFIQKLSSIDTTKTTTATQEIKKRDADGCHHVFIDGGANIGVHGRFLLEPEKYPDATFAHKTFNTQFGTDVNNRDNRDFCVYEIEPNPAHYETLMKKSRAYSNMGWRYHVMNVGLSDQDEILPFYRRNDTQNEEWGFSTIKFFEYAEKVEVPIIRFSKGLFWW